MEKGNCQLCGQNGMIYKDSQICKICFCNSRETVKEYEIKDKTERGRCSQCG
jgi:ribosomal protein S14